MTSSKMYSRYCYLDKVNLSQITQLTLNMKWLIGQTIYFLSIFYKLQATVYHEECAINVQYLVVYKRQLSYDQIHPKQVIL